MSKHTTQYMPFLACDSLVAPRDSVAVLFDHRAASADELFSSTSINLPERPVAASAPDSNLSYVTATGIVVIICLYCWFVARFYKSIAASIKASASIEDITMFLDNQSSDLRPFLRMGEFLFFCSMALQCTIIFFDYLSALGVTILMLGAIIYLYFALILKRALSLLTDIFDQHGGRFRMLDQITRFDIAVFSVLSCPLIIICSTSTQLSMISLSIIALIVMIHWWRVLLFFKLSGFSILQWILYLCTLELLPFTLIVGVLVRLEV